MNFAKPRQLAFARLAFAVTLLAAPAAMAQQTLPPSTEPPAATEPTPTPPAAQPSPGVSEHASPAPSALLGKDVFSSDQTRLGKVEKVIAGADGKTSAIQIKTGGFLGFGGKMVSIPDSRIALRGENVQVQMTSEEVGKLPEVKDGM